MEALVVLLLALLVILPIILAILDRSPIAKWLSLLPAATWFVIAVQMASPDMPPPLFMIVPFLLSIVPVWRQWSPTRKHAPDLCGECGYNLTGNTSGICPECGSSLTSRP